MFPRQTSQNGSRLDKLVDQLLSFWTNLGVRRQILLVTATLGVFLGVLFIGRSAVTPDYALLYSGLDAAAAGEVVSALDQRGIPHEIVGGSIRVPRGQRDRLRMLLASEGMPANGTAGYELLDSLSGFGTTSQMFDAAYWRAKEGELARTIAANPGIRSARVHISNLSSRPFQSDDSATASINVTPAGTGISISQARALRFLVSSAVAGLPAEAVTVINGSTGEIVEPREGVAGYQAASDRAAVYRTNLLRLLEAHVGIGNAVVEVNVETVSETETILERRFDPDQRVIISSDTTERSTSASGSGGGAVTIASNLPDGDAAASGNDSQSSDTETRERVNFEVSETTREIRRMPGSVARISVAALVDGAPLAETGEWVPRTEEELSSLEALIASAIGFDAERGDSITLRSLPLERSDLLELEGSLADGAGDSALDTMSLIRLGVVALVTLILALFVLRPIVLRTPQIAQGQADSLDDSRPVSNEKSQEAVDWQASALSASPSTSAISAVPPAGQIAPHMAVGAFDFPADEPSPPPPPIPVDAEAVARLRSLISERREETLEVLRGWMETIDERDNEGAR